MKVIFFFWYKISVFLREKNICLLFKLNLIIIKINLMICYFYNYFLLCFIFLMEYYLMIMYKNDIIRLLFLFKRFEIV